MFGQPCLFYSRRQILPDPINDLRENPFSLGTSAMPIQYLNRNSDTYFLHGGKTKTGKPRWFFSKKIEGNLEESIPAGYEIYENHNAQVFLRLISLDRTVSKTT